MWVASGTHGPSVEAQRSARRRDASEQRGFGASGGESDARAGGGLGNGGGDFDQAQTQGGERATSQFLRFGSRITHRQHELICCGVQDKAKLVGRAGSGHSQA